MKSKLATFSILVMFFLLVASGSVAAQAPIVDREGAMGTAFTYQGRLNFNGSPISEAYDFQFALFDALTGGSQVGALITVNDLELEDGYFTVNLDFGTGVFNGQRRYLEVRVHPGAQTGSYSTLAPRQELTAAPNALYALSVPWGGLTGVPAGFADGIDSDTQYSAGTGLNLSSGQFSLTASYRLPQACATNQIPKWNSSAWICASDNDTTGFWSLTGNAGTNPASNYLGTSDNQAFEIRVNGWRALRLEPRDGSPNVIEGSNDNFVTNGVEGATIGGGGSFSNVYDPNIVYDDFGTIGGGGNNRAGSDDSDTSLDGYATIGGGIGNQAISHYSTVGGGVANMAEGYAATIAGGFGGLTSNDWATIGGGQNNRADGQYATVAGGNTNLTTGPSSTVGGGWVNTASGNASTVPGGANNEATGAYSFAAGADGHATHAGSFVWSSATRTDSWGVQTFTVRAPGGVRFYSAAGTTTGAVLPAGGGGFSSLSDRAAKQNFSPVNAQTLLDKVAALPMTTWNYKSQDESIRHIGPMAQDFYASFGVGEDEKYITSIDADGVALAAIQGLYLQNQQQAAEMQKQATEIQSLKARLSSLEASGKTGTNKLAPTHLWAVVAMLALSQAAMFILLRRKAGQR